MTTLHIRISGFAVYATFLLTACSHSVGLDTQEAQSRQAPAAATPLDTPENLARAIGAMRYSTKLVGLGSQGEPERPADINGAQSGVHEYACNESGHIRFDETLKVTTFLDCQAIFPYGLGGIYIDGAINEDCRGQTGDIRCVGGGTPDAPFALRIYDNDEEVGGESDSHVVLNTANTAAVDVTISVTGTAWRSRPLMTQSTVSTNGFRLIQNVNAAGNTEAIFFGSFFITSDEAFRCVNGSLTMQTLSPVEFKRQETARDYEMLIAGQVRISNNSGQFVIADFLPEGSVVYRGSENQVGAITEEDFRKFCPDLTVNSTSDDEPNSVTLRMFGPRVTATRLLPPAALPEH